METLRTITLIAHFAGLALLTVSLLWAAFARSSLGAARWIVIAAGLMGVTGLTLVAVRANLDLPVDVVKMAVKTAVLIAVFVCATRLRRLLSRRDGRSRRQPAAFGAAIAALVVGNAAIAFGWN